MCRSQNVGDHFDRDDVCKGVGGDLRRRRASLHLVEYQACGEREYSNGWLRGDAPFRELKEYAACAHERHCRIFRVTTSRD